ncbi:MAG: hypothetical protein SFV24_10735, partial [Gemmatimonadales bacterium]|nr:hypothetical protein [Gemmatimonadales bacterium]
VDLKARFDALKSLQALNGKVRSATDALRDADEQFAGIRKALADSTKVPAAIRATMDSLKSELDRVKRKFGIRTPGEDLFSMDFNELLRSLPIRVAMTSSDIGGAHLGLSETNRRVIGELQTEVPAAVADANGFLGKLAPFYRRLAEAGLYPAAPEPIK